MPAIIEKLEKQKSELEQEMSTPGFYDSDYQRVRIAGQELLDLEGKLEAVFERWGELESGE